MGCRMCSAQSQETHAFLNNDTKIAANTTGNATWFIEEEALKHHKVVNLWGIKGIQVKRGNKNTVASVRIHSFTPFTQHSLVEFTIYFIQSFKTEPRVLGEWINIPPTLPTATNNSDQMICHMNKMCLRLSTIYRLWHLFHPFPCLTYSCKWKIHTTTPKGIFPSISVAAL